MDDDVRREFYRFSYYCRAYGIPKDLANELTKEVSIDELKLIGQIFKNLNKAQQSSNKNMPEIIKKVIKRAQFN